MHTKVKKRLQTLRVRENQEYKRFPGLFMLQASSHVLPMHAAAVITHWGFKMRIWLNRSANIYLGALSGIASGTYDRGFAPAQTNNQACISNTDTQAQLTLRRTQMEALLPWHGVGSRTAASHSPSMFPLSPQLDHKRQLMNQIR